MNLLDRELECLGQFLNNLKKEQEALLLNDVKTLKETVLEREEIYYETLKVLEASQENNEQSFDGEKAEKKKNLSEAIQIQSLRNQNLLQKKLRFNKTLIQRLHPAEENPTYDVSGACKGKISNRVIINQEV